MTLKVNGTGFDFETDQLIGTLQPKGSYHGVTRLIDRRSGRQFIDERYSALNLFKLFSTNLCMGQLRRMERKVSHGDNWMEIFWGGNEFFQGDVTARYTISGAATIDLTLTTLIRGSYPAFEIFLSNYFDQVLVPHVFLKSPAYVKSDGQPELLVPVFNGAFRGTVIVFPRDTHGARRCVDGRWDRSESANETVQMCPVRHYEQCFSYVADRKAKLAVVLMAVPFDCYAISTRYHPEREEDRLVSYSAFDFSLFGHDALPSSVRTVKVRLAVTSLDEAMSQPRALYEAFLTENQGS